MTDQPFNRTILYPLEKPLADDLNQEFSQADRSVRDTMFQLLLGQQGFIWDSFKISPSAPPALSVVMKQGQGYQDAPTDAPTSINSVLGLNDLSRYKPLLLSNDLTVAVPAPPGANSRIDLIEVRYNRVTNNPQSRNFLDPNTNAFNPANVPKTLDFNLDGTLAYYAAIDVPTTAIAYKSGVAAVSPVPPAVDTGYMAVAYITVASGAVTITAPDISDQRPGIVLAPGTLLNRQIITANGTYTPTFGTKKVVLKMVGGGAGGGGAGPSPTGGRGTVAGGGASGVYIEKTITGAPIVGGAVVIGAGGNGGADATGDTGGDTTITINATVYTAKGGLGGKSGGNDLGPPSVTLGGDIQGGSSAADFFKADVGGLGVFAGNVGGNISVGGNGGSGALGTGGRGGEITVGSTGIGYGSGGGGGATWQDATARNGGSGAAGVVILDEYA